MKTPKRSYEAYLNHLVRAHYTDKGKERRARWKRKNRIAQLKRTIARLTKEMEREKSIAYHKGHYDGYQAGFASLMF